MYCGGRRRLDIMSDYTALNVDLSLLGPELTLLVASFVILCLIGLRRMSLWAPILDGVGLKLRGEIAERMFTEGGMSPGGLGAGVAPYIMPKLGETYSFLRRLKTSMDPNGILNPELLVGEGT